VAVLAAAVVVVSLDALVFGRTGLIGFQLPVTETFPVLAVHPAEGLALGLVGLLLQAVAGWTTLRHRNALVSPLRPPVRAAGPPSEPAAFAQGPGGSARGRAGSPSRPRHAPAEPRPGPRHAPVGVPPEPGHALAAFPPGPQHASVGVPPEPRHADPPRRHRRR
jgi:hypothetical protein